MKKIFLLMICLFFTSTIYSFNLPIFQKHKEKKVIIKNNLKENYSNNYAKKVSVDIKNNYQIDILKTDKNNTTTVRITFKDLRVIYKSKISFLNLNIKYDTKKQNQIPPYNEEMKKVLKQLAGTLKDLKGKSFQITFQYNEKIKNIKKIGSSNSVSILEAICNKIYFQNILPRLFPKENINLEDNCEENKTKNDLINFKNYISASFFDKKVNFTMKNTGPEKIILDKETGWTKSFTYNFNSKIHVKNFKGKPDKITIKNKNKIFNNTLIGLL